MTFEQLKKYAWNRGFSAHEKWYKNVCGKVYHLVDLQEFMPDKFFGNIELAYLYLKSLNRE